MTEAKDELDDTRIFGMTHAEFEALPQEEKDRLLIPLRLDRILESLGKLSKLADERGMAIFH